MEIGKVLFSYLFGEILFVLFSELVIVANECKLTLLLHTLVNFDGQLLFVLLFDGFNIFPSPVLYLFAILFMGSDHHLYLL